MEIYPVFLLASSKETKEWRMHVTEIYYENIDWRQFPFGLADWASEIALKADKDRTPEERERFKQQVVKDSEADRLMMAQQVELLIVGVSAHYITPWGGPPVTGQAFEEDAIDLLIAAGNGDPFVVHALAAATAQLAIYQLLHQTTTLRPLAEGERPRRLTRAEVEGVVAEKDVVVQAIMEQYAQQQGPLWKAMIAHQRKSRQHRRSRARSKKPEER
jgi:hypothetical protein